jgi:hypothetical protein
LGCSYTTTSYTAKQLQEREPSSTNCWRAAGAAGALRLLYQLLQPQQQPALLIFTEHVDYQRCQIYTIS